jgi:hypothetical protein
MLNNSIPIIRPQLHVPPPKIRQFIIEELAARGIDKQSKRSRTELVEELQNVIITYMEKYGNEQF